ncbi:MAG: hypothetical protein ACRDZZ_03635, partial [Ilumatobacteraceae bacterium]
MTGPVVTVASGSGDATGSDDSGDSSDAGDAWIDFARALLTEAVANRRAAMAESDDRADGATLDMAGAIGAADAARARLHDSLAEPSPFAVVCANARLAPDEAEVLALALGCEADADLHRLLGYLHGDATRDRLTLGTVITVFGDDGRGVLALAPGARLRRAALLDVLADGPWADHAVTVHPQVVWALLGDESADPELSLDLTEVASDDAGGHPLLTVSGRDRMRNRREAANNCAGTRFLASPAPDTEAGWMALVREATITGRGVIVEVDDSLSPVGRRWIERADHLP